MIKILDIYIFYTETGPVSISLYFFFEIDFFHHVTSSCSQIGVHVNPVEAKRDNVESLIDLGISSDEPDGPAASQTQHMPSTNNDNWNAFESSSTKNTSPAPSANSLEALLFELSVPSTGADNKPTDGPGNGHAPATVSGSTLTPDFAVEQTALPINVQASVAGSPPQLTSNKSGDIAIKVINGQLMTSAAVPNLEVSCLM